VAREIYGDDGRHYLRPIRRGLAVVAAVFGAATVMAGARVLAGFDAEDAIQSQLVYNMAMGMAYLAAGVITWHSLRKGMFAAAAILAVNLVLLGRIGYLYAEGNAGAVESLRATTFRTVVWLLMFLGLMWLNHRRHSQSIWVDPR